MVPKTKNIILFVAIAVLLTLIYVFFFKRTPVEENLISSSPLSTFSDTASETTSPRASVPGPGSALTGNFLSVLLSIKSVELDDAIFTDRAFVSLRDSSILLIPTGDEGRPNPFAPIGYETAPVPKAPVAVPAPMP